MKYLPPISSSSIASLLDQVSKARIKPLTLLKFVSGEKSIVAVTLLSRPAENSVSEHENIIRMDMKNIYLFIRMVLKFMSKFNYYYCITKLAITKIA